MATGADNNHMHALDLSFAFCCVRHQIFVRSKKHAHRLRIIFGLADLKVAELHGSLTQQQRLESLQRFQNHDVEFLICSDLAGRGLDLPDVKTVSHGCTHTQADRRTG